jgi:hypothetical protein
MIPMVPLENSILPKSTEQINPTSSWLTRTIKWLRADDEQAMIALAKNILAFVLGILLAATLIGIPVVWVAYEKWEELGELNRKPLNLTNLTAPRPQIQNNDCMKTASSTWAIPTSKMSNWERLNGPEVMKQHNKSCQDKSFNTPLLKFAPFDLITREKPSKVDVWPTLEGIALLADNLCEKKKVSDLYVCKSLATFKYRLEKIDRSTEDVREVLIVPCYQDRVTCPIMDETLCHKEEHQSHDYHAQHKVPVMIEKKKNGELKICVMDSGQDNFMNMSETFLDQRTSFSCSEQIHAHIRAANLKSQTIYYLTKFHRHHSHVGGCDTFALQDAISFLRMPNFFEEIEKKGGRHTNSNTYLSKHTNEEGTIDNPYYVSLLPPDFVRLTQSIRQINDYVRDNKLRGDLAYDLNQKLGKKEKAKTFQQKLGRTTLMAGEGKSYNLSIDYKIDALRKQILNDLATEAPEKIHEKINRRLLLA